MKKLHETVYILSKCDQNIQTVWKAINEYQQKTAAQLRNHFTFNLMYYIILEADSYLKEFKEGFTTDKVEEEFRNRVLYHFHLGMA